MRKSAILTSAFLLLTCAATAMTNEWVVTYDEHDVIHPTAAQGVISNACSAVVAVNIAEAKAVVLTNVTAIANKTLTEANELLAKYADYSIIDLYATGLTGVDTNTASSAVISIVKCAVDRTTQAPSNTLVTLTWQYVTGSFNTPEIIASASLTNDNTFVAVPMTDPEQVAWGTASAYRSTATVANATYGTNCFFKVRADLNAPIDDGKVFDIFSNSGGVDQAVIFRPSNTYKMTFTQGRLTSVDLLVQ